MTREQLSPVMESAGYSADQEYIAEQQEYDEKFLEVVAALEEIQLGKRVLDFAGIPDPELKDRQVEPGPFEAAIGRVALGTPF